MPLMDKALTDYFKKYPVPQGSTIGVAVSGGADSLCLTLHLMKYARENGLNLMAATVDHGLRPESKIEAEQVHILLERKKIPHTILQWIGPKPKTRVEEKARDKRYELLSEWCHKNEIKHLFLAHHQGDQAETFWARLARGSGINGLCAMAERTEQRGIYLCRPFLHLTKSVLESDLTNKKVLWFEDQMNQDDSYERVRWRRQQKNLSDLGLTPNVVDKTTIRLARAKQALDFYTKRFEQALVDILPQGYICLSEQAFLSIPDEIKLRVIKDVLSAINPMLKVVSLESLEQWLNDFPRQATLGGCILARQRGILFIGRENSRMPRQIQIPAEKWISWDRFDIYASKPTVLTFEYADKNLPHSIRKAIPSPADRDLVPCFVKGRQKELEKKVILDYKKKKINFILFVYKGAL